MSGTETLWQELICRLEGVQAAQVIFAQDGSPSEIHVLACSGKNSKSLVRDIQSALTAQFGVQIDHRIISIAQIADELLPHADFRLAHTELQVRSSNGHLDVAVTLSGNGKTFCGTGECANTPFARRRCVAEAAMSAVNKALGEKEGFQLASVDCVTLSGQPIIVSQVFSLCDGRRLIGSSYLNDDPDNASVHSVLSAVNRRLAVMPRTAV